MPSPKIYQVANLQSSLTAAHNQANAAYAAANTASSTGGGGFDQANNAYAQANGAYGAANNRVLKAGDTMTGQLNISSGGLLVTGNVGFGTSNPAVRLHVSSGTSGNAIVIIEADTDNDNENDTPKLWFRADGGINEAAIQKGDNTLDIISNVDSGAGINFLTGTTNNTGTTDPITGANSRMFITNDGLIGINTTTPTAPLTLVTPGSTTDGTYFSTFTLRKTTANSTAGIRFDLNNTALFRVGTHTGGDNFQIARLTGTGAPEDGNFWISASTGYVGIGTTNPGTKLQISESSANPELRIHYSGSAAAGNKGVLAFLHNRNSDNSAELLGYIQGVAQDNQSAGGMRFVSRNNTDVEVMRMVSSGNVGIGTTNPQVPLHVNRSGTSGNQTIVLGLSSDSGRPIIQFSEGTDVNSGTGMAIEYDGRGTGGTNAVRINSVDNVPVQTFMSNGWVGFGTSSPVAPLNIVHTNLPGEPYSGIIVKNTDTSGAAYTGVTADGVLQSHYRFAINGNLKYQLRCGNANGSDILSLYSWALNDDFVSFSNTGRVGIGTTNPGRKLDVRLSSSTVYSASSMETSSLFSYMRNPDGTTGAYAGIQFAISNNSDAAIAGVRTADAACAIAFGTRGASSGAIIERMRIASDGQVTMSAQPRFYAYGVTGGTYLSGSYWIFPTTAVNTGGHYNASNGIFTAPVAGTYFFFWGNIGTPANDVMRYYIYVNNAQWQGGIHNRIDTSATGTEYGHNGSMCVMMNLNASDYVRIYFASDAGTSSYPSGNDSTNIYPYFGGYLMG